MANGWHVIFEPTIAVLTPQGGANFSSVNVAPGTRAAVPRGSFPVITALRIDIKDDNKGPPPLLPGAPPLAATLELFGRPKQQVAAGATPPVFVSLGIFKGKVDYTSGAKPRPRFTCDSRKVGGGPTVVSDFTPGTDPVVTRSDWILPLSEKPPAFVTVNSGEIFNVQLPWVFVENPALLQLSARLTVNGKVEADENKNLPLDIPLQHLRVPDDTSGTALTFFGVHNIYATANELQPNPNVVFVNAENDSVDIIMHSSLVNFINSAVPGVTAAKVLSAAAQIVSDAGFFIVNTVSGPKADALCKVHWKLGGRHFMGAKITNTAAVSAAIDAGKTATIPDGEEEIVPFFEFCIFAENVPPPSPTELGHSERFLPNVARGFPGGVNQTQVSKMLATPIVIATGGTPLPATLAQFKGDVASQTQVLASTICHEIGHSFGLRHGRSFTPGPTPLASVSVPFARGVMGTAGTALGLGTPTFAPQFFGPVHVAAMKKLFKLL